MTRAHAVLIVGVVALLACLARFVHLDADPSVANWVGYVVDEGRWNETARNLALFGTAEGTANARLHLLLTPAYQLANVVVFGALGVDFWSARLLSAIAGALVVLSVYFAMRRHVPPLALATGVVLLGFEPSLLMESRLAVPEMPSALATLATFLILVFAPRTTWSAFIAGLCAAFAVALKATTVMVMPVFVFVVILLARGEPSRVKWWRAGAFVGGIALLGVIGAGAALAVGIMSPSGMLVAAARILDFLQPTTPYIGVLRYFDAGDLEGRNLLLLGVWMCTFAWWCRPQGSSPLVEELYLASLAWTIWWLVAWSASLYLPGRYVVHFVIPATVNIVAGLALLDRDTPARLVLEFERKPRFLRFLMIAWLVLPMAILVATVVSGSLGLFTVEEPRLALRVGIIAGIAGVLAWLFARTEATRASVVAALLTPILAACAWLLLREWGVVDDVWHFEAARALLSWTGACLLIAAVTFALARRALGRPRHAGAGVVGVIALALAAQTLPAIVWPTYSIRDASRDIGRRLGDGRTVRAFSAESLFLGNHLRFRAVEANRPFDALVVFEHGAQPAWFMRTDLARNLIRVAEYPLNYNPRYETESRKFGPVSVGIYVSNGSR